MLIYMGALIITFSQGDAILPHFHISSYSEHNESLDKKNVIS